MARFRLTGKHYLNTVPSAQWEQVEQSLQTGKMFRKRHEVATYLNPEDPSDQNYPGQIIVSTREDPTWPADIIFKGPPGPDMEPLDNEAREMVEKLKPKWAHPIDALPANGELYSDKLIEKLSLQIEALAQGKPPSNTDRLQAEIEDLKRQVAALTRVSPISPVRKP